MASWIRCWGDGLLRTNLQLMWVIYNLSLNNCRSVISLYSSRKLSKFKQVFITFWFEGLWNTYFPTTKQYLIKLCRIYLKINFFFLFNEIVKMLKIIVHIKKTDVNSNSLLFEIWETLSTMRIYLNILIMQYHYLGINVIKTTFTFYFTYKSWNVFSYQRIFSSAHNIVFNFVFKTFFFLPFKKS